MSLAQAGGTEGCEPRAAPSESWCFPPPRVQLTEAQGTLSQQCGQAAGLRARPWVDHVTSEGSPPTSPA